MIARAALAALAALALAASASANPAAPPDLTQAPGELVLAGVRYGGPLGVGQTAWLIASPGDEGAPTACDGCTLARLACNTVCTYRITARALAWRVSVGSSALSQGGRLYFPWVRT